MAVRVCDPPVESARSSEPATEVSPTSNIVNLAQAGLRQSTLLSELSKEFRAIQLGKGDNSRFMTAVLELPSYRMADAAHEVRALLGDHEDAVTPVLVETITTFAQNLRERRLDDFCELMIADAIERSQFLSSAASASLLKGSAYLVHADLYLDRGELDCARNVFAHALDVLDGTGSNGARAFLRHINGVLKAIEGSELSQQRKFFIRLERAAYQVFAHDDPAVVMALRAVARHYEDIGNHSKAEQIFFRLLTAGAEEAEVGRAGTLKALGALYERMGKQDLRAACYTQARNCENSTNL